MDETLYDPNAPTNTPVDGAATSDAPSNGPVADANDAGASALPLDGVVTSDYIPPPPPDLGAAAAGSLPNQASDDGGAVGDLDTAGIVGDAAPAEPTFAKHLLDLEQACAVYGGELSNAVRAMVAKARDELSHLL